MNQDEVLSIISAFGPISTVDLNRCMRFGHDAVANALHILKHTGEIVPLQRTEYGAPRQFWVAR